MSKTIEDRLDAIEVSLKENSETTQQIKAQLEVITPRDMVEIKTNLARVETRVYGITALIATLGTTFVSWVKGLIA